MECAARLNRTDCDVAIHWSGGQSLARSNSALGFCYVNDAVLAIIELLRLQPRVLYINIDTWAATGVEEAFWKSNRVCVLDFHTGSVKDTTGIEEEKNKLNVGQTEFRTGLFNGTHLRGGPQNQDLKSIFPGSGHINVNQF